jgi:hypothetical protein
VPVGASVLGMAGTAPASSCPSTGRSWSSCRECRPSSAGCGRTRPSTGR